MTETGDRGEVGGRRLSLPQARVAPAGELELYDQPQLLAEFRRLRTRYAAGRSQVENPRVGGSHGDLAQALALVVYEQRSPAGRGVSAGAEDAAVRPTRRRC
jgi:hypothetical protein